MAVALVLRLRFSPRVFFSSMPAKRKKKTGAGALAKKRLRQEDKYKEQVATRDQKHFVPGEGKPEILSAANEEHCQFALKFAQGVHAELDKVQSAAAKYASDADVVAEVSQPRRRLRSVYGFFGKSTLLVESLTAETAGCPHISIQLGVPGCGKSTFLKEFLRDVYSGQYAESLGRNPSMLIASTTNLQCKELFKMILEVHDSDCSVPLPLWCISAEFAERAMASLDAFTLEHGCQQPEWPRGGSVIVCTHDYASLRFASAHFHIVVLDEIGAMDAYKGHCLLGLGRRMAKLMGDPLQGSRPCATLADKHLRHVHEFKAHSYRCPQIVMEVIEPAYQALLDDASLRLSGNSNGLHWCVQTEYNPSAL